MQASIGREGERGREEGLGVEDEIGMIDKKTKEEE